MLGGESNQAALLKDKRIRIITASEIRYEGTLYQINTKDKTITLKNVVTFGTEDRKTDEVIPPSQNVYEIIIFKASHIKDINVLTQEEEQRAQVAKVSDPQPAKETGKPAPQEPAPPKPAHQREASAERRAPAQRRDRAGDEEEYAPKPDSSSYQRAPQQAGSHGEKGYSGHNAYKRESHGPRDTARKDKGPKDFDFDQMVQKNNLLEKEKEMKEESEEKEDAAKYNPDDFFDPLSTSVNDRPEMGKKDPYHLYKTNNETFGFQKRPFRGSGGGRYRGSRGGSSYGGYGHSNRGGPQETRERHYGRSDNYDRDFEPRDRDAGYQRGGRGGGPSAARRGSRGGRGGFYDDYDAGYEKKH